MSLGMWFPSLIPSGVDRAGVASGDAVLRRGATVTRGKPPIGSMALCAIASGMAIDAQPPFPKTLF
jgi:hypothetical protein